MGTITGIGIMINTIFGEVRFFVHTPLLTLFGLYPALNRKIYRLKW